MMTLRVLTLSTCAFGLILSATSSAQTPPKYSVEFLGDSLGATAINASAQMVGSVSSPAVRGWVAGPGAPLALLPLPPGRISSWANDINDLGAVAGAVSSNISPDFGGVAAVWYPDGSGGYTVVELGMLPGDIRSNALGLNAIGDVIGYSADGTFRYPVLFTGPSGIQDLTSTGLFDPQKINEQRVLIDVTGKRMDLDTMVVQSLGVPVGNYAATICSGINEQGQVSGAAILTTSTSCIQVAARYTDGMGWQVFSGCGPYNAAVDMNDLGDVVLQLNVAPYVRFEGLGTFLIEDLIQNTVGHWYVLNGYGLAINNARQMAVPAKNLVTGKTGLVLLTPESDVGTPLCFGDGSAGSCPCGNASGSGSGEGCVHSGGIGAVLGAFGSAIVADDDLVLHVTTAPANAVAVFVQGATALPVPFKDGLLCAGSPLIRLQQVVLNALGSASSSVSIVAAGGVVPGTTRVYQTWFRDPTGPCAAGSNLSSALQIDWQ